MKYRTRVIVFIFHIYEMMRKIIRFIKYSTVLATKFKVFELEIIQIS